MQKRIVIIGGGIVGLATAMQLHEKLPDVKIVILEKENDVARHQSGHNSGVIHSGIYYKPGSNKAKNCTEGYAKMLRFCDEQNIPYQLIGKLIVANDEKQKIKLDQIYNNGLNNGLKNIKVLKKEEIQNLEPNVRSKYAIHVPQAGIVDYKLVSQKMRSCLEGQGVEVLTNKKAIAIDSVHQVLRVACEDESLYEADFLVNCAGLQSDRICALAGINSPYRIIPFKGVYYYLNENKKEIVKSLIYPVPDPNFPFLGIHYTKLMNGQQTLGPNAILAFDRENYANQDINWKDLQSILSYKGFWKLIGKHWNVGLTEYFRNYSKHYFAFKASEMTPGIVATDLTESSSGIRAQVIDRDGNMVDDFAVLKAKQMIHICNAPSPAATASLSIGDQIAQMITEGIS
ncbi:MAG TPA: L-2-hydroxyglutarate oxidase [Saprospiraceae bacterium]|nr:L-2-hydroxyglutarate oxidase [Saprospiraceae bacterium]